MKISLEAADDGTYSCTINGIRYMRLTMNQALELIREAESDANKSN